MTDTDLEDPELEDHPDIVRQRLRIKELEKENKDKADALARAEAAERKLAFAEAGISPTDPKMNYFVKGYEGELTADAIKAAAVEAGFLDPPEPAVPDEQVQATRRMAEASANGGTSPQDDGEQAIRETTSEAEVLAELARRGVRIAGG